MRKILALSSSRVANSGYLETAAPLIHEFLGQGRKKIAFIPFAAVDRNYEDYVTTVRSALAHLPYDIFLVDDYATTDVFENVEAVMVGGGNTFKLLHDVYQLRLLDVLRERVNEGMPYIGWSAGSNITGLTISTTNDMPIIQPESFKALGIFPFQINPHYRNEKPENFHGETRDQRLEEFIVLNPGVRIVGLPEGTALSLRDEKLVFMGNLPGVYFQRDEHGAPVKKEIQPGDDLGFML